MNKTLNSYILSYTSKYTDNWECSNLTPTHEQAPVAFKLAIIALAVKPLDANFKKSSRLKRVEEVGGVIERTDNILLT